MLSSFAKAVQQLTVYPTKAELLRFESRHQHLFKVLNRNYFSCRLRHGHRLRLGVAQQGQAVEGHQAQVRREGGVKNRQRFKNVVLNDGLC